jgi:hypothetical protein
MSIFLACRPFLSLWPCQPSDSMCRHERRRWRGEAGLACLLITYCLSTRLSDSGSVLLSSGRTVGGRALGWHKVPVGGRASETALPRFGIHEQGAQ